MEVQVLVLLKEVHSAGPFRGFTGYPVRKYLFTSEQQFRTQDQGSVSQKP